VIDEAVDAIERGQAVIVPTDTVYGLAASAFDADAALGLYRLKSRPSTQPMAVLASSVDTLLELVPELGRRAGAIARALLPGPFTLVLPNPARRFAWLTGEHTDTIGVRVAELPEPMLELVGRVRALAATSANLRGGPDPAKVDDVPQELRDAVGATIDVGELPGVASTVIDFTAEEPRVIREGAASGAEAIERARRAAS
jgi:tRNA threonylcarbamoyl adenosine modification protein (Sua5/YciO/YrdC/YwlC family)